MALRVLVEIQASYRKTENFVACVVTCVNHSRTNSLCCQIWYLAKLNIRTL